MILKYAINVVAENKLRYGMTIQNRAYELVTM